MIKFNKKVMSTSSLLLLFSSVGLLGGCYQVSDYSGDGLLIDHGGSVATDRYILDFGPINFSHKSVNEFHIGNLPDRNFIVGIKVEVSDQTQTIIETKNIDPIIKLQLIEVNGGVVFNTEAKLSSWTWSMPLKEPQVFIYGRGENGTYFQPSKDAEYTLILTVLEIDYSKSNYRAQLIAKSGGWK